MITENKSNFPSQDFQGFGKEGKAEVRELRPEEFWGGSVSVEGLTEEEFSQKLSEAANELNFTYSGYLVKKSEGGFEYHFSRYPRRAFGPVPPIEKHQKALEVLAEKLGVEGKEEKLKGEPKFRVLLGLQEGYSEYKKLNILDRINKGQISSLEEAKKAISLEIGDVLGLDIDSFDSLDELKENLEKINLGKDHNLEEVEKELGKEFDLTQAEIYSVGPWGKYTEPAVVIEGNKNQLQKVYALAEKFHQSRIAVEDLGVGQSYMVETKYCEDPDKE